MKFVWAIVALAFVAAGAVTLRPDLLPGAEDWMLHTPMAHLISVRPWIALGFLGIALFLLIFSAIRAKMFGLGKIALATGVAYLVMAIFQGGTVYMRGVAAPTKLGPDHGVTAAGAGNGAVTVMAFNTLGGSIDAAEVAHVAEVNGVDVMVLPETSTAEGADMVEKLAAQGLSFAQFDTGTDQYATDFESTVVLVSEALGEYRQVSPEGFPASTVVVTPADGKGPKIIGVHPVAPVRVGMEQWESDISAIYSACQAEGPFIIAGDFNSTIDHQLALGATCADGRIEAGSGGLGTWPAHLPALLGAPIDRVLHDGNNYRGVEAIEIESGTSDHRGVIVRLAPAGDRV